MDHKGENIQGEDQIYVLLEEDKNLPQLHRITGGECRKNP